MLIFYYLIISVMAKLNDTTVIMVLLFLSVIGMVISTGYKNPHFLSYKFVTIYNIQGNCRYCKVWIN